MTFAATIPVSAAIPIPVAATVPIPVASAAAIPVPVTPAVSVPMAALIGKGRADQMMDDIDRGEGGARKAQGHEA